MLHESCYNSYSTLFTFGSPPQFAKAHYYLIAKTVKIQGRYRYDAIIIRKKIKAIQNARKI